MDVTIHPVAVMDVGMRVGWYGVRRKRGPRSASAWLLLRLQAAIDVLLAQHLGQRRRAMARLACNIPSHGGGSEEWS